MATESTDLGFDRFGDLLRSLEEQATGFREKLGDRGREVASEFQKRADQVREQVTEEYQKRESQFRETPFYKRAAQVAEDVEFEVDRGRTRLYDAVGIATKDEVSKLNKKLNAIAKKLNQLTRETPEEL